MEPEVPEDGEAPRSAAGRRRDPRGWWRANLRLIAGLLSIWALVSYGLGIVFVEPLNRFRLGGFPLGFWFAQQGAIYTFVVLIAIYAVAMDRIDRRFGVDREPERSPDPAEAPASRADEDTR